MDDKVTGFSPAESQLSTVRFLNGDLIQAAMLIDPMDAKHFLESRGVTISSRMYDQTMQDVGDVFKYEIKRQLHMTGGLPERCIGCSSRKTELRSHRDDLNHKHKFGISLRCNHGGCDQAREEFVENAEKLERQNELYINLDVEVESVNKGYVTSAVDHFGMITAESCISEKRISIASSTPKCEQKGIIRVNGLSEAERMRKEREEREERMRKKAKAAQKEMELQRERELIAKQRREVELALAAAKEQADIEDSLEILLNQQSPEMISERYGQVAW